MTKRDKDQTRSFPNRDDEHTVFSPANEAPTIPTFSGSTVDRQVGPYRLISSLGEGGMGEVFLAEQSHPIKRQVALKLIKAGMDTREVITRFEAERQALAILDHSAVAKVFDAGATSQGRPYFAMEYVKGVPITEYCDRNRLTNQERLELFCEVCAGVQHAHQKAIIHRDLKPSNILVTEESGRRVPKIIDFGVAKATGRKLTEETLYTGLGVMIGTPEYMSPEQADPTGEDVDTRTDVYSLGVVLYNLLTGLLPFDSGELRKGGIEGIRLKIREEEPNRPSTRISKQEEESSESAGRRRVTLSALRRQLKGDLDWIVMRALEKDRNRRYGSPAELAADIRRFLAHEPVLASPPSAGYRSGKFVRRHRVGVLVAVGSVLALVGFSATMGVQAQRIAAQRDRAEKARSAQESVVLFQAEMLSEMDTEGMGERLIEDLRARVASERRSRGQTEDEIETAAAQFDEAVAGVNSTDAALRLIDEEIMSRAMSSAAERFSDEPLIEAHFKHTMGLTYIELGLLDRAEIALVSALDLSTRFLGTDQPQTISSMASLARLYGDQGRYAEAESLYLETLDAEKQVYGIEHFRPLETMGNLAIVYSDQGRYAEAESLYVAARRIANRVLEAEHTVNINSMNNLATLYHEQGRFPEAEQLYVETLEVMRRAPGDGDASMAMTMNNLAFLYSSQGRQAEAESMFVEVLEIQKRVLGSNHPGSLALMHNLGILYSNQGRFTEAEALFEKTLAGYRQVFDSDHPNTLVVLGNQALLFARQGRHAEAESLFVKTLASQKRVMGEGHPIVIKYMFFLSNLYRDQGRLAEAESLYLEFIASDTRIYGSDHPQTFDIQNELAILYHNQDRLDEAESLYLEVLAGRERLLSSDHPSTLASRNNLGALYWHQERFAEAETQYIEILKAKQRTLGTDHPETFDTLTYVACLSALQGDRDRAMGWLREMVDAGYDDWEWMATDTDLEDLHGPAFEDLVDRARRNGEAASS